VSFDDTECWSCRAARCPQGRCRAAVIGPRHQANTEKFPTEAKASRIRCRSSGAVCIRAAEHADNGDLPLFVVDPVEHAVGTATSAVAIVQRRSELLANSVGIVEQRTDDEVVSGKGD